MNNNTQSLQQSSGGGLMPVESAEDIPVALVEAEAELSKMEKELTALSANAPNADYAQALLFLSGRAQIALQVLASCRSVLA